MKVNISLWTIASVTCGVRPSYVSAYMHEHWLTYMLQVGGKADINKPPVRQEFDFKESQTVQRRRADQKNKSTSNAININLDGVGELLAALRAPAPVTLPAAVPEGHGARSAASAPTSHVG